MLDTLIILLIIIMLIGLVILAQVGISSKRELDIYQKQKIRIKELEEESVRFAKIKASLMIENRRYREDNEKLANLINDLCKTYNIPIEDFKQLREKYGL